MKITLENTTKIVELNGVPTRIWEGHTASGIPVHAHVALIGVEKEADRSQFEEELQETRSPSPAVEAIPMRMVV